MGLKKVRDALLTVTDKVYHYEAWEESDKYIVWAEDSYHKTLSGDGQTMERYAEGTIDYFSREEYDPAVTEIMDALERADIPHYLNTVQWHQEEDYIHHEWVFEVRVHGEI